MRKFEDFQAENGKYRVCQVLDNDGNELHYYQIIQSNLSAREAKRLAKELNQPN